MDPHGDGLVEAVAGRLAAETGLTFEGQRRSLLRTRLEECSRAARAHSLHEFCTALLAAPPPEGAWRDVIDAVATDETSWFRYEGQFRILREFAVPVIASNKSFAGDRTLRILSAGCSRGHEPYSIALTLASMTPPAGSLEPRILGVDISSAAVRYARRGHYADVEMRGMPRELRDRAFCRTDSGWKLDDSIRAAVEFRTHNLLDPLPPESFDLVFCRNVTIYFTRATADRVIGMLVRSITPGGYLFLGHAETIAPDWGGLRPVQVNDATVYRRATGLPVPERVP